MPYNKEVIGLAAVGYASIRLAVSLVASKSYEIEAAVGDVRVRSARDFAFVVALFTIVLCPSAWGWQVTVSGSACAVDAANAVALDGAGDVVAAGFTANETFGGDFTVVKLAAATGQQRWRQVIDGDLHVFDQARAVTVDAGGDVVAVGTIQIMNSGFDFAVVKMRGSDGAILWRQVIDSAQVKLSPRPGARFALYDEALGVVTDSAGDVIAVGLLAAGSIEEHGRFFAIKFRGSDGTVLWHYAIGDDFRAAQANAVTVDHNGDVLVAGFTTNLIPEIFLVGRLLTVVKLDGVSGAKLWWGYVSAGYPVTSEAQALAVTRENDVVVAGSAHGGANLIARLRGGDGAVAWQAGVSDQVNTVAVDATGDVVAAGSAVFKLSGLDGTEIWHRPVDGFIQATVTDPAGDVLAGGYFSTRNVFKLSGATGTDLWPGPPTPDAQLGVNGLAVDTAGDVVAAGESFTKFIVAKLNGQDGSSFGGPPCEGDCDRDGRVSVDELVAGVNIALGAATVCTCNTLDLDGDGKVTIDEVVRAVNASLNGCDDVSLGVPLSSNTGSVR